MKRYRAERVGDRWCVRDRDPAPGHDQIVATDLTQHDAEQLARSHEISPPSMSGTWERRQKLSLEDWAREHCITILPSGALIYWSRDGLPWQVERDGGGHRRPPHLPNGARTTEAVKTELLALMPRAFESCKVAPRLSHESRREARATNAMIRAENAMPLGSTDEDIEDAGWRAYEEAME